MSRLFRRVKRRGNSIETHKTYLQILRLAQVKSAAKSPPMTPTPMVGRNMVSCELMASWTSKTAPENAPSDPVW